MKQNNSECFAEYGSVKYEVDLPSYAVVAVLYASKQVEKLDSKKWYDDMLPCLKHRRQRKLMNRIIGACLSKQ